MTKILKLSDIKFPIVWFSQDIFKAEHSLDALTLTTRRGAKRDFYKHLVIVDYRGLLFKIAGLKEIHTLGKWGGWTIFGDCRIRADLLYDKYYLVSLDEFKSLIFKSFDSWSGWEASDDLDEFRQKITLCLTLSEVIDVVELKTL